MQVDAVLASIVALYSAESASAFYFEVTQGPSIRLANSWRSTGAAGGETLKSDAFDVAHDSLLSSLEQRLTLQGVCM